MNQQDISLNLTMAPVIERPLASTPRASQSQEPKAYPFNLTIRKLGGHLVMLSLIILLSVGAYQVISRLCVQTVQVVGTSMVPTLAEHGRYLLNRWAYHNHSPQHGDIVVIRDPGDHGFSVKRVIATSGEAILLKDGQVFVDGKQLDEEYIPRGVRTFTYSHAREQLINCGQDQYFVMGDNRPGSIDSRVYGPVRRQDVLGRVDPH